MRLGLFTRLLPSFAYKMLVKLIKKGFYLSIVDHAILIH
jgi:hypothetical protein